MSASVNHTICSVSGWAPGQAYLIGRPNWWTCDWERANFFIAGVLFKIVPCICMTVTAVALVRLLIKANRRRRRVMRALQPAIHPDVFTSISGSKLTRRHGSVKTTKLMILIVSIFLFTELPHGLLVVTIAIKPSVFVLYQQYLGNVLDMVTLVQNTINFLLLCSMNSAFRQEFVKLLKFNGYDRSKTVL